MSGSDDFYYRRKPSVELVRLQNCTPEARGFAITYESQMFMRDGTVPDERDGKGMEWHLTVQGVRNPRTVHRIVKELLDNDVLIRMGDGRLTMEHVLKELAARGRGPKAAKKKGGGGEGSGGAPQPELTLIDGGRSPQRAVESAADKLGELWQAADDEPISDRSPTDVGRKAQRNHRSGFPLKAIATHDVVVVTESEPRPRARGHPPPGHEARQGGAVAVACGF